MNKIISVDFNSTQNMLSITLYLAQDGIVWLTNIVNKSVTADVILFALCYSDRGPLIGKTE